MINWKRNCEALEKKVRAAQEGCHKLRIERDAAERARDEAIVRAAMPVKVSSEWSYFKFLLTLIVSLSLGYGVARYTQTPLIQYKWIEGHTVYRPDPQQEKILKDCQQDYHSDKVTIRIQGKIIDRLRTLLMQEMEGEQK